MDQIAKGEKVTVDPTGSVPEIEIRIMKVAVGLYSSYLIKGSNHPLICKGKSSEPVKSCPIGSNSASLPGCKVSWQVGIASVPANSPFRFRVTLRQGGQVLQQYTYDGTGDDFLVDYVTLA